MAEPLRTCIYVTLCYSSPVARNERAAHSPSQQNVMIDQGNIRDRKRRFGYPRHLPNRRDTYWSAQIVPWSLDAAPPPFTLSTIHSQITAIILFGLIIIVLGGSMLEQRVGNGYPMLDIDTHADRVFALSSILKTATPEERDVVVLAARRAGWDLTLQPSSLKTTLTTTSPAENMLDAVVDFLFPPDGTQTPVGGWKTFLDGKRVVSAEIDQQTMLVLGGLPDQAFGMNSWLEARTTW
uniref:hypothetical protein n=1 Tax=Neorhizobium sp. EC2-8 TaxID=3129230 RepID=UPI0031013D28